MQVQVFGMTTLDLTRVAADKVLVAAVAKLQFDSVGRSIELINFVGNIQS